MDLVGWTVAHHWSRSWTVGLERHEVVGCYWVRRISTQGGVPTSSTLALYKPTRNGLRRSAKGGAMSPLVNTVELITPTSSRVLRIVSSISITITGVGNNLATEAGTDSL